MILPKVRDPRFVTTRQGGTLTAADHRLLAERAATRAAHVLGQCEFARPGNYRPSLAIQQVRAWARCEASMSQARAAGPRPRSRRLDPRPGR